MSYKVLPVILTCGAKLKVTKKFAASFANVMCALEPAIVFIDQSGSPTLSAEYLAVVSSIGPAAVYVHPREIGMSTYDSVQEAANLALAAALHHSDESDYILFLEDDIVFSSQFSRTITNTHLNPETGFLTLYQPGSGYGSLVVDPSRFYGSQCLLFTRKAVDEIVRGRDKMMANFPAGYDIRWSKFLAQQGYVLYCTDRSYVQHQSSRSRLRSKKLHRSDCFLP
jgi:hypothetical protein